MALVASMAACATTETGQLGSDLTASDVGGASDLGTTADPGTPLDPGPELSVPDVPPDVPSDVAADLTPGPTATVSGRVFIFGPAGGALKDAKVTLLEHPQLGAATTDAQGDWSIAGVPVGSTATAVLDHSDYTPNQTGTHVVPKEGFDRLAFQAVGQLIYDIYVAAVGITPDPTRCQISTTVTWYSTAKYPPAPHGEAGATVTIEPPLSASHGPVYFNASVIPDPKLTETSADGGVVFTNVPPGTYTLRAHKAGVAFEDVVATCRAGLLVNAAPPRGLQAKGK